MEGTVSVASEGDRSSVIRRLFEEYDSGVRVSVQELNDAARQTLAMFADHRTTGDQRPSLQGRGPAHKKLTLTSFLKCLEFCGLKTFVRPVEASLWATHMDGDRHMSIDYILHSLIDLMACDSVWWLDGAPPEGYDPEDARVKGLSYIIRRKIAAKAGEDVFKEWKFDPIGDRLSHEEIGHLARYRRPRRSVHSPYARRSTQSVDVCRSRRRYFMFHDSADN